MAFGYVFFLARLGCSMLVRATSNRWKAARPFINQECHMGLPAKFKKYSEKKVSSEAGVARNVNVKDWITANTRAKSVNSRVSTAFSDALMEAAPKTGEKVELVVYDLTAPSGKLPTGQYVHVKGKVKVDVLVWEDETLIDNAKLKEVQAEFRKTVQAPTLELLRECETAEKLMTDKEALLDGDGAAFKALVAAMKAQDQKQIDTALLKVEMELDGARTQVNQLINNIKKANTASSGSDQRAGIAPLVEKYDLSPGEEKLVSGYFLEHTKAVEQVRAAVDSIQNRLDRLLIKRKNTLSKVKGEVTETQGRLMKLIEASGKFAAYVENAKLQLKIDRLDPDPVKGLKKAAVMYGSDEKLLTDQIATYEINLKKALSYQKEAAVWSTAIANIVAKLTHEPRLPSYKKFKDDHEAWTKEITAYPVLLQQYIDGLKKLAAAMAQ
jgi:hypothetical protein